ncbi:MAG: hypothetical protein K1Y36_16180 [Blastocatellia bacterium]|nr:hypothetical protein [Blastocatellia bacterium]
MKIRIFSKQLVVGLLFGWLCFGGVTPLYALSQPTVALAEDQGKNKDREQDRGHKEEKYIFREEKRPDPPRRDPPPRQDPPRQDPPRDKKKG